MFDTILKGGEIHDGIGSDPFIGDVGIKDGVIVDIAENLPHNRAEEVIDVAGLIVSPDSSTCIPIPISL